MKKVVLLFFTSLMVLFSASAFAGGLYVSGQFGRLYHNDFPNINGTIKDTVDKYGYRFGLGYDFANPEHPNFEYGAMLGYGYYGKVIWLDTNNNAAFSHDISGFDLQGTFTYHANRSLDLIAHSGGIFTQDTVTQNFRRENKNHFKPIVGLGLGYNINPQLEATFDYSHIFGDNVRVDKFNRMPSMNIFWLGLRYKFKGIEQH